MDTVGEAKDRTPSAPIEERVTVEGCEGLGIALRQQGGNRRGAAEPRVDPAVEAHHEDGCDGIDLGLALV